MKKIEYTLLFYYCLALAFIYVLPIKTESKAVNFRDCQFTQVKPIDTICEILDNIVKIEAKSNNDIGDSGRAFGRYQIHLACVKDVNKRYHLRFTHTDMLSNFKRKHTSLCV